MMCGLITVITGKLDLGCRKFESPLECAVLALRSSSMEGIGTKCILASEN